MSGYSPNVGLIVLAPNSTLQSAVVTVVFGRRMEPVDGKKMAPRVGLESHQAWPDLGRPEFFPCACGDLMVSYRYPVWFYEPPQKKR